jgi:hypothetical protein
MSTERERRYTVPPGPGVRSARSAHSSDRCSRRPDALRRRLAAVFALVVGAATLALAVTVAISEFPRGLVLLGCALVAGVFAWYGLIRRGIARAVGLIVAGPAVAVAVALIVVGGSRFLDLLVIVGLLVSLAAARATLGVHVDLPSAPSPRRPVLFFNPRSGGGKAERFALAKEARDRGIEPIELKPGDDLEVLVRRAVERGADGLAMAGGDGSQAVVAAIAAELGLPYACVPAGTRNHFALDLGVDREDVVGALDAFVDGGQRRVDLAEVNGRVFVNNVFAWPLRRGGSARRLPRRQDPHRARHRARRAGAWRQRHRSALDRAGGHEHHAGVAVLVSNNRYRLGRAVGSDTRPRIDHGLLGIIVVGPPLAAARTAIHFIDPCVNGPHKHSKSIPTNRSPPVSTVRLSSSIRR